MRQASPSRATHTFSISEKEFLLDGRPFLIRCGEIHFQRVPREYWRHRLEACRALGLNAVCVYLFWNFHEWREGVFDWSGQADAAAFCELAHELGLCVLLRPGPYACAEWEMGGLPWWLLKRKGIRLRSTDPAFLEPAMNYLMEVGRVLAPLQISAGGPILMAQVENEYGSFGSDPEYMGAVRDCLVRAGFTVPLFACNPPSDLRNGYLPDLLQVVNFGIGGARVAFERLAELQPDAPLMNGEYYPAWFDTWGKKHCTAGHQAIVDDLRFMIGNRHSFSMYMAHGGTSFGLWAGADRPFRPDTTSYDYDAPISEAGWTTAKFDAMRTGIRDLLGPGESLPEPPAPFPTIEIPEISLPERAPVFKNLPVPTRTVEAAPFEDYDHARGMAIYRTVVEPGPEADIAVTALHDFGWVYLDGACVGVLDRRTRRYSLTLPSRQEAQTLDILVYAMGRVNFGEEMLDLKGVHGPVTVDGHPLVNWEFFPFTLDPEELNRLRFGASADGPAFYRGRFHLEEIGDSFLDLSTWGKGVVWVNGRTLGRYWNIGPTQTMYVPGPWLRPGLNEIVILDLIGPTDPTVRGLKVPILDHLRPELDFSRLSRARGECRTVEPCAQSTGVDSRGWNDMVPMNPPRGRFLCFEASDLTVVSSPACVAGIDLYDGAGVKVPKSDWSVIWASSEETIHLSGDAENLLDGQSSTAWYSAHGAHGPHRVVIDLGMEVTVSRVRYLLGRSGESEPSPNWQFAVSISDEPFGLEPLRP